MALGSHNLGVQYCHEVDRVHWARKELTALHAIVPNTLIRANLIFIGALLVATNKNHNAKKSIDLFQRAQQ